MRQIQHLKDENSNSEVTYRVFKPLQQLARELDVTFILCHHTTKEGKDVRGAYDFQAKADSVLWLKKGGKSSSVAPDSCVAPTHELRFEKLRYSPPMNPLLLLFNEATRTFSLTTEGPVSLSVIEGNTNPAHRRESSGKSLHRASTSPASGASARKEIAWKEKHIPGILKIMTGHGSLLKNKIISEIENSFQVKQRQAYGIFQSAVEHQVLVEKKNGIIMLGPKADIP